MNPVKNRRRGKRAQREIAKILKGLNIGILGNIDIITEKFAIEIKDREKVSVENFLIQAEKNNKYNKTPIAIVHIRNKPYLKSLVIIRLEDFLKLIPQDEVL